MEESEKAAIQDLLFCALYHACLIDSDCTSDFSIAEVHNAEGLRPDEVHNAGEKPPQEIQISCTSEYQEYAFDEKHDIWGLVTLKAPCQADDENEEKRAPIDIVAVIDKSGSMSGTKLKLVKKTLEFILTQCKLSL